MKSEEILRLLNEIFIEVFDDEHLVLTMQTSAKDIADWDSFRQVNLLVASEQRFGVKFQTTEINGLFSVGDMVQLLAKHLEDNAFHV